MKITPLEARSLVAVFKGKERAGHEAIYWEHEGNQTVRQGKWKLVAAHGGAWELYDLEADRTEQHDLAGTHPAVVDRLKGLYERWAERCGVQAWLIKRPK